MSQDTTFTPELIKTVVPTSQASVRRALRSLGNPVEKLKELRQLVSVLVKQLSRKSASFPLRVTDRVSAADRERDRGIEADEVCVCRRRPTMYITSSSRENMGLHESFEAALVH